MLKVINKTYHIFIDILVFLVTIIILFLLYSFFQVKVLGKSYPTIFDYSIFQIATGSMEPALSVKDIILVKKTDDFNVNDIVTYTDGNDLITHRIIGINGDIIETKGDANNSIDNKINKNNVVGKVVYVLNRGGYIKESLMSPKVIISVVITLLFVNIYFSLEPNKKKLAVKVESKTDKMKEIENSGLIKNIDAFKNMDIIEKEFSAIKKIEDTFIIRNLNEDVDLDKTISLSVIKKNKKNDVNLDNTISINFMPKKKKNVGGKK